MLIECRWCGEKIKEGQTACGMSVIRVGPNGVANPCGINIVYHVRCWFEMLPGKPKIVLSSQHQ
jgi:hypothetical protein